jgi:CheY-like chemotaxis protein
MNLAPSESIVRALVISNDALVIKQVSEPLRDLAASTEVCGDIHDAIPFMSARKFEALVVDLTSTAHGRKILQQVRLSPSNRTAVAFAVTDGTKQSAVAFDAGTNFVLERPLSPMSVCRTLKAAYALIVRERLRYFRCPVSISAIIRMEDAGEIRCESLNISEGGMAIMTSVPLKPGSRVTVRFTLPGQSDTFAARSEVCWCDKESRVGLRFLAPSSEQKSELKEWLGQRLEDSLPESVASKFRSTV